MEYEKERKKTLHFDRLLSILFVIGVQGPPFLCSFFIYSFFLSLEIFRHKHWRKKLTSALSDINWSQILKNPVFCLFWTEVHWIKIRAGCKPRDSDLILLGVNYFDTRNRYLTCNIPMTDKIWIRDRVKSFNIS